MLPPDLPPALLSHSSFLLARLGIGCSQRFHRVLEPLGLKPKHFGILSYLDGSGAASQRTIAEALRIDPSLVVALLDVLEKLGAVSRQREAQDRRRMSVRVTDSGRKLLRRCRELAAQLNTEILAGLTEAERSQLQGLLLKLAEVDRQFPSAGFPSR